MTDFLDSLFHAALLLLFGLAALGLGTAAVGCVVTGVMYLAGDAENVMQQQAQGSIATAYFLLAAILLAGAALFGYAAEKQNR